MTFLMDNKLLARSFNRKDTKERVILKTHSWTWLLVHPEF